MKKCILNTFLLLVLLSFNCYCQQTTTDEIIFTKEKPKQTLVPFTKKFIGVGTGYEFSLPISSMANDMSPIHSINLNSSLPLHFITPQLQMGIDIAYGLYGSKRFGINYTQGGNYINTNINYSSDIAKAGIHANYLFLPNNKIQPYLTASLGYIQLSSRFSVEDPSDPTACRVLDNETILSDGTLYWGYGVGFRWNVGQNTKRNRNFIDFSITQTQGNNVDYVNINHLHNHSSPQTPTDGTKPLNVTFINASNQNIHQHRIAEVYTNSLNLLQFKIGYTAYLRFKKSNE